MNTRRTERIAGALFISATVSSALGFIGALRLLIDAIAVVAIQGSLDASRVVDNGTARTP